jgi:hypothetical protein
MNKIEELTEKTQSQHLVSFSGISLAQIARNFVESIHDFVDVIQQ